MHFCSLLIYCRIKLVYKYDFVTSKYIYQYLYASPFETEQFDVIFVFLVYAGSSELPTVRIEPRFQTVTEGDPVEFRCIASGNPQPEMRWYGGQGGVISPESSFVDGYFRIPSAKRSDEAEYFCEASNEAGTVNVRTVLYITGK